MLAAKALVRVPECAGWPEPMLIIFAKVPKPYAWPPNQLLHRIKSILCYEEERALFPMNEMIPKFSKILFFSNQFKILDIQKCYSIALMFTIDVYLK